MLAVLKDLFAAALALLRALFAAGIVLALTALILVVAVPYVPNELAGPLQAVAGIEALLLTAGLGSYAITQVRLAKEAQDDSRRTRKEDQEAKVGGILRSIFRELERNRWEVLRHEGRVEVDPSSPVEWPKTLVWSQYDLVNQGPLWELPKQVLAIEPVIAEAYRQIQVLNARARPLDKYEMIATAAFAVYLPIKVRLVWFAVMVLFFGQEGLRANSQLRRRRTEISQVRAAIEKAMEVIHREISGEPLSWAEHDSQMPLGLRLPSRRRLPLPGF